MKRFLGIFILAQMVVSYGWGMEKGEVLDEKLAKALRVMAINQDKDLRGLPIERVFLEADSKTLVVSLKNINGTDQTELAVDPVEGGFIAGSLRVFWDVARAVITGVEEIEAPAAAPVSTSTSAAGGGSAAAAPSVSEQVRMATKDTVGGDIGRALGSVAGAVAKSGDGKKILKKLGIKF